MTRKPRKLDNIRDGEKWCPQCELWVKFEDFTKNARVKLELSIYCKSCQRDIRDRKTKDEQRDARYRRKYGVTIEQYNQLLSDQSFRCAVCRTPEPGGVNDRFHLDHDHITGNIRGLLCSKCNRGLGWAQLLDRRATAS